MATVISHTLDYLSLGEKEKSEVTLEYDLDLRSLFMPISRYLFPNESIMLLLDGEPQDHPLFRSSLEGLMGFGIQWYSQLKFITTV
jgi:hypothetical protein